MIYVLKVFRLNHEKKTPRKPKISQNRKIKMSCLKVLEVAKYHCVKSVRIRDFLGSCFPAFELNTDQKILNCNDVLNVPPNVPKIENLYNFRNLKKNEILNS